MTAINTSLYTKMLLNDYYQNYFKQDDVEKSIYYLLHLGLSDIKTQIIDEVVNSLDDNPSSRILIKGKAGSGKTFILNQILRELYAKEKNIIVIDARNIDSFAEEISLQDIQDKILIIDGLDEASQENYSYLKRLISSCNSCIATIRFPIDKKYRFISSKFDSIIEFEKRYGQDNTRAPIISLNYNNLFKEYSNQYRYKNLEESILLYYLLSKKEDEEKVEEALEKTVQAYDESGQILLYSPSVEIPPKEIVLPSREIITNVNVLQASLVEAVQKNPEFIYNMSSRQFEEFVAEMYEKQGYRVELTKMTRDGGKDIILYTDGPTGHNMFYVECKKYRKNNLVDVGIVRNFYGVVEADKATAGILVTSSSFTPDARSFERQVFHRMTLVDYVELISKVAKINA